MTSKPTEALQVTLLDHELVDQNGECHGQLPDPFVRPGAVEALAAAMAEAELLELDAATRMDDHRATAEAEYNRLIDCDPELGALRLRLQVLREQVIGPWELQLADRFIRRDQRVELPLGPVEVVWPKPRRTVSPGRPVSELVAPRGRADLSLVIARAGTQRGATPQAIAQAVIDEWLRPQTSVAAPAQPVLRLTAAGLAQELPR